MWRAAFLPIALLTAVVAPAAAQSITAADSAQAARRGRETAANMPVAGYFLGGFIAGPATAGSLVFALSGELHPAMAVGPVGLGWLVHRAGSTNLPPSADIHAQVAGADSAYAALFLSSYNEEYQRRKRKAIGAGALIGLVVIIPLLAASLGSGT